jgi:hypothetical protein
LRPTAIIILLLIIVSVFIAPASASDVTIAIEKEQVQAKFMLSLHQNVTLFPNQTSTLDMASDAKLSSAFAEGLKSAAPSASPSALTVNVDSTRNWLNLTTTMTVSGVTERHGDILAFNTTWRAFNVSSDLRAGNFSYNTVGRRYFLPVVRVYSNASRFVGRPNATITGVIFYLNKTSVGPPTMEHYVGNFTMFDFRPLSPTLDQWARNYTLTNNTTTWRYLPPQRLGVSMQIQRGNVTTTFFASYGYSAEISIPALARAQGNTILVDVGTGQKEWIMAGIVALALVLALATQVIFRARKKKYIKFGRW